MVTVVVYTPHSSPRLTYVLDWLLKERLQTDYVVINNITDIPAGLCTIVYGTAAPNAINIPDSGLLWQKEIKNVPVATGRWQGIPTLFAVPEAGNTIPFDLFSAVFYLISRYEEYLPFAADKYGRYPHEESMLYKNGWLQRPLVDEWIEVFRVDLQRVSGLVILRSKFTFQPTYDIDIAYSHIFKGIKRIVGAYIKAIMKGDLQQINERTQVLKKKQTDPYDSFSWLRNVHSRLGYRPIYFVLCALKTTAYDKNIHPRHPAMIRVIKQLAKEGEVGIHPSFYANKYDVMAKETDTLARITGHTIAISRQHYIKLDIPKTFRLLIDNEITDDYSMGYGAAPGFRAGTGSSFLWYDLEHEKTSALRVHPFCFMDTTAHYEGGMTAADAFTTLEGMKASLMQTGSTLITIFHNFSLGTAHEWAGWASAYEQFLAENVKYIERV